MEDLMKTSENGNGIKASKVNLTITQLTRPKRANYVTVLYVYTSP